MSVNNDKHTKLTFVIFPEKASKDYSFEMACCPPDYEFSWAIWDPHSDNHDKFYEEIADADAIINSYTYFGRREIDALRHCKVISFRSTGYNNIDLDYATEKGIAVCSILDYCTQETAENAMASMLCLQRNILVYNKAVQEDHTWALGDYQLYRIEGQVLGIAGLGRIGQAVARMAKGFNMEVIAYDPYLPPEVAKSLNIPLVDKDTLFAASDVISLHMNLTNENYHFINKENLLKCKKHPIIVNEGRGQMVNEADLAWALDEGIVRGAALDMLETESPSSEYIANCPLVGRSNVILCPHSGFLSQTSTKLCAQYAVTNAVACVEGRYKDAWIVRNGIGL